MPVAHVRAVALSVPLVEPLPTSFGAMDARSTLLVALDDGDGHTGWGEVWCNFPTFGARHRARYVDAVMAPRLLGQRLRPGELVFQWEAALHVLALQTGEPGPIAQVLGGLDMALWDLAARRAAVPLHRLWGSNLDAVPVYASGINPTGAGDTVRRAQGEGHTAFKLKVGFGRERDLENVAEVAKALRPGDAFMLDANQGYGPSEAVERATDFAPFRPAWLEEPLPADAANEEWQAVAGVGVPLAAGENWRGLDTFGAALRQGWLGVAQPDAGKWGGLTGGLAVAALARSASRRFCPHHLGGAVGLVAAAHLVAAHNTELGRRTAAEERGSGALPTHGVLEMDVNPNPLRTALLGPLPPVDGGRWPLSQAPGLGLDPDLNVLSRYAVA